MVSIYRVTISKMNFLSSVEMCIGSSTPAMFLYFAYEFESALFESAWTETDVNYKRNMGNANHVKKNRKQYSLIADVKSHNLILSSSEVGLPK